MAAEIPQNLEGLVSREQQLVDRIGKKQELALKLKSEIFGRFRPEPSSLSARIRERRRRIDVIQRLENDIVTKLTPKLTAVTTLVDEGAKELALNYEKEGRKASAEFANLQKTASFISGQTNTPAEDLLGTFPQELAEFGKKPLTDPTLERGLNLLDEQRQEAKTALVPDRAGKESKKGTYDRRNYEFTLPDGQAIIVNGSIRARAARIFIQSFENGLPLSITLLTSLVYGSSDKNNIEAMQLMIRHLKEIFGKNDWGLNNLTRRFYGLEKIQQTEEVTPPVASEPEQHPVTGETKKGPRIPEIPAKNIAAMETFLIDPDLTLDHLIAAFGTTKKNRPYHWRQALQAMWNTARGIFFKVNRGFASKEEIQIHDAIKQDMQTDSEGEALGRFITLLDDWFRTKQAQQQPYQPTLPIEGTGKPEEEIIEPTAETLTRDESILLARRILNFDGSIIRTADNRDLLKAEIDPSILELAQRVRGLFTDADYSALNPEQRREITNQALAKADKILKDTELLNDIYNSQTEDIQILLLWLFTENEKYGGELIRLLGINATTVHFQNDRNLQVLRVERHVIVDAETAAKILSAREQKAAPPPAKTPPVEEETPEDTEDGDGTDDIDDDTDDIGDDNLEKPAEEQGEEKRLRLSRRHITRQAPEVNQELIRLQQLLADNHISGSISSGALIGAKLFEVRDFYGIKSNIPSIDNDNLTPEDILLLLFLKHNDSNSLRPNDMKQLKKIIKGFLERKDK